VFQVMKRDARRAARTTEGTLTAGVALAPLASPGALNLEPWIAQPATPTTAESGGRRRMAASTQSTAPQAAVNCSHNRFAPIGATCQRIVRRMTRRPQGRL
jgi:hypothetical protein